MSKILANIITLFFFICISLPAYGRQNINVTATLVQQDKDALKKYVMETVAKDIKRAKKAGKLLVRVMGGVSNYAYDSIPWSFFDDEQGIQKAFERLCDDFCVRYIQEGKEEYKKSQRNKRRVNKSQLGEFLHRRIIDILNISDADKQILKDQPSKTDEFVKQGIINKDDYTFYNLLNLILQYYVEKEHGRHS